MSEKLINKILTLIKENPNEAEAGVGLSKMGEPIDYIDFIVFRARVGDEMPISYGIFVSISDLKVDITIMEKTFQGNPRTWPTSNVFDLSVNKNVEEDTYNQIKTLYDFLIENKKKLQEEKVSKLEEDFLSDKLTFDNPLQKFMEEIAGAVKKRATGEDEKQIIQEPIIYNFGGAEDND